MPLPAHARDSHGNEGRLSMQGQAGGSRLYPTRWIRIEVDLTMGKECHYLTTAQGLEGRSHRLFRGAFPIHRDTTGRTEKPLQPKSIILLTGYEKSQRAAAACDHEHRIKTGDVVGYHYCRPGLRDLQ